MQRPRSQRYQSLDVWRGIACLSIVLLHSTYYVATKENDAHVHESLVNAVVAIIARMWVGVPMFFVISGYCIAASAESVRTTGTSTATFLWRRLRRIYPPFWALFGMAVVTVGITEYFVWPGLYSDSNHGFVAPWLMTPQTIFGYITLTVTWIGHFLPDVEPYSFLGHAWTLCYEEQFYAVVGIGLLISRKNLFAYLTAVSILVIALNVTPFIPRDRMTGFFFDGKWLHFALGLIVYYDGLRTSKRATVLLRLAIVAMMFYALLLAGGMRLFISDVLIGLDGVTYSHRIIHGLLAFDSNDGQQMLAAAFFAMILSVLRPFDESIARSRAARPFVWCGTMCYSLYLVHWPLVKAITHGFFFSGLTSKSATLIVTLPVCIVASLISGWLFHVHVERRFLNSR